MCPGGRAKKAQKRPADGMSNPDKKWDNLPMNELIKTLQQIGLPAAEIERVKRYYGNDIDGMRQYVLYMRAMFDDRHEYMA
jgi:hypothetical protein